MLFRSIRQLLDVYLRDTSRARILMPDGSYVRARPPEGEAAFDSQAFLIRANMTPR